MTEAAFRALALSLPGAVEGEHMGHPDFRVRGKIFATLGPAGAGFGMLKLRPEQQARLVATAPDAFQPFAGAWGKQGATRVELKAAARKLLEPALRDAYRNVAPGTLEAPTRGEPGKAPRARLGSRDAKRRSG